MRDRAGTSIACNIDANFLKVRVGGVIGMHALVENMLLAKAIAFNIDGKLRGKGGWSHRHACHRQEPAGKGCSSYANTLDIKPTIVVDGQL